MAMTFKEAFQIFEKYYTQWASNAAYQPAALYGVRPPNLYAAGATATSIKDTIDHIDNLWNDNTLINSVKQLAKAMGTHQNFTAVRVDKTLYTICFNGAYKFLPEAFGQQAEKMCTTLELIAMGISKNNYPTMPEHIKQFYRACGTIIDFFTLDPPTQFA